jgi:hypothetical protein
LELEVIWGIGKDQVYGVLRQGLENLDAITMQDLVEWKEFHVGNYTFLAGTNFGRILLYKWYSAVTLTFH